jgi:hypothetical protein
MRFLVFPVEESGERLLFLGFDRDYSYLAFVFYNMCVQRGKINEWKKTAELSIPIARIYPVHAI